MDVNALHNDILRQDRVDFKGPPGSGKTTMMAQLIARSGQRAHVITQAQGRS